uniref:Aquaporin n=1 Tax=Helix pomatia TaxID=6536 RepID=A0A1I7PJA1_HELPO|nr:aquaporin [Helix pomatia]
MHKIMEENVDDLLTSNLWLSLVAEFTGTLAITLLGCGAWLTGANVVQIALTFGLTVATMAWVFNHISGAHFNPAVTIASLFTRRVSIIRGVLYIIIQIAAAISGSGILYRLTPRGTQQNLGANELSPEISTAQGFGIELLITFVYMLAVSASGDEKRSDLKGSAPLTIGLAVVTCQLFAIPYTRAGMNPARSFGPALIVAAWKDHWVFWLGPLVGATLAGLLYEYIFAAGATFTGLKQCLLQTKRPRKQPESEKAPLEEVKDEVIEIDESKVDEKQSGDSRDIIKGDTTMDDSK